MRKADHAPFLMAMQRLSVTFNIALSELRLETYWDALQDLPMDALDWACRHVVKYAEKFPTPSLLREYVSQYRQDQAHRAADAAAQRLPQWSSTPDEVGVQAIRHILQALGEHMAMTHPAYQQPSTQDPEARKAEIREQVRLILAQERQPGEEG